MRFFCGTLVFVLALMSACPTFGEEIKTIHIVTPSWEGFTNADGSGLFFDIVRGVYESAGVKMRYDIVPWKRAEHMLDTKKADAMLCVAPQNMGRQLAPKYPMVVDYVGAVFKKDRMKEWKGAASLAGREAIWIRGYDFHKNPHMKGIELKRWDEVDSYASAWKMLEKNRTEIYLDSLADMKSHIRKNRIDMAPYRMETVWGEKMYMAFADSGRSKKLIRIYDKRIMELFASGKLRDIFDKWKLYPFPPDAWSE